MLFQCPICNRMYDSKVEMMEHYNKEIEFGRPLSTYVKDTKDKPLIGVKTTYLGGHSAFTKLTTGFLYLFSQPHNKVIFESDNFVLEIPINEIRETKVVTEKELSALRIFLVGLIAFGWKKEKRLYLIKFVDELGETQSVFFNYSENIEYFAPKLYNLRLEEKRKTGKTQNVSKATESLFITEIPKHLAKCCGNCEFYLSQQCPRGYESDTQIWREQNICDSYQQISGHIDLSKL